GTRHPSVHRDRARGHLGPHARVRRGRRQSGGTPRDDPRRPVPGAHRSRPTTRSRPAARRDSRVRGRGGGLDDSGRHRQGWPSGAGHRHMKPELYRIAGRCLTQLAQIEPQHHVLVVTDSDTRAIGELFAAAAGPLAAEVLLLQMETRTKHGQDPPAVVAAAMAEADVIVQAVKYALTHTDATRAALARNAQVFVLRGITEEMLLSEMINVDFTALR